MPPLWSVAQTRKVQISCNAWYQHTKSSSAACNERKAFSLEAYGHQNYMLLPTKETVSIASAPRKRREIFVGPEREDCIQHREKNKNKHSLFPMNFFIFPPSCLQMKTVPAGWIWGKIFPDK